MSPRYPSGLSLSLNFKVSTSVRCDRLRNLVLKPWKSLHGIKCLALAGNIGDSMRQHLLKNMLGGPFPTEVAATLTEYHSVGQKATMEKNYSVVRWLYTLYEDYWKHLRILKRDPSVKHEMKDSNNFDWNELWTETRRMYLQGKLAITRTYLHQSCYGEALVCSENARYERILPFSPLYILNPRLNAMFHLCEALAHTALGDVEEGESSLSSATIFLYHSALSMGYNIKENAEIRVVGQNLQTSISTELVKLDSPHQCNLPPNLRVTADIDCPAGMEGRSFWEWLDLPED